MMFETVEMAPPDPILGLSEAFRADPNPDKINLGVGVYKDASGNTPVLQAVKQAERRILEQETSKGYLPIDGAAEFARLMQELLFGSDHEVIGSCRAATSHAPGGTGALRVAANFLHAHFPAATVWLSEPTWPNHPNIFAAAGVPVKTYPYFDPQRNDLQFGAMLEALGKASPGDVVLLHGCCHNPTGVDPTLDHWKQIAELLWDRKLLPLVDFAYQGFARSLQEDAAGLDLLCAPGSEALICSSLSKNFGLYRERVGALTVVAGDQPTAANAQSQVKAGIRANYSNPPSHGAAIATTILGDPELTQLWQEELAAMRERINGMRMLFVETLQAKQVAWDFSFIARQHGMFSMSGLSPEQVDRLREDYSVYIVRSGRINVAGMTEGNMDTLCSAIKAVL